MNEDSLKRKVNKSCNSFHFQRFQRFDAEWTIICQSNDQTLQNPYSDLHTLHSAIQTVRHSCGEKSEVRSVQNGNTMYNEQDSGNGKLHGLHSALQWFSFPLHNSPEWTMASQIIALKEMTDCHYELLKSWQMEPFLKYDFTSKHRSIPASHLRNASSHRTNSFQTSQLMAGILLKENNYKHLGNVKIIMIEKTRHIMSCANFGNLAEMSQSTIYSLQSLTNSKNVIEIHTCTVLPSLNFTT